MSECRALTHVCGNTGGLHLRLEAGGQMGRRLRPKVLDNPEDELEILSERDEAAREPVRA